MTREFWSSRVKGVTNLLQLIARTDVDGIIGDAAEEFEAREVCWWCGSDHLDTEGISGQHLWVTPYLTQPDSRATVPHLQTQGAAPDSMNFSFSHSDHVPDNTGHEVLWQEHGHAGFVPRKQLAQKLSPGSSLGVS